MNSRCLLQRWVDSGEPGVGCAVGIGKIPNQIGEQQNPNRADQLKRRSNVGVEERNGDDASRYCDWPPSQVAQQTPTWNLRSLDDNCRSEREEREQCRGGDGKKNAVSDGAENERMLGKNVDVVLESNIAPREIGAQ